MQAEAGGNYGATTSSGLKRLALEAPADGDFYARLREDPQRAAESIGVTLTSEELSVLRNEVHWAVVDAHVAEMREALHMGVMRAGPVW
jgi:hypothetical protein